MQIKEHKEQMGCFAQLCTFLSIPFAIGFDAFVLFKIAHIFNIYMISYSITIFLLIFIFASTLHIQKVEPINCHFKCFMISFLARRATIGFLFLISLAIKWLFL